MGKGRGRGSIREASHDRQQFVPTCYWRPGCCVRSVHPARALLGGPCRKDRIIAKGGFISVNTGNAQDANNLPIPKKDADDAFNAAACIGCGACVATCKNSSAMLFTSAKISQLALLPQGQVERVSRAKNMIALQIIEDRH